MIVHTSINGRAATVAYLHSDWSLASEDDADLLKVVFDDGDVIFLKPQRSEESVRDYNPDPKWTKGEGGRFTGSEPGQGGGEGSGAASQGRGAGAGRAANLPISYPRRGDRDVEGVRRSVGLKSSKAPEFHSAISSAKTGRHAAAVTVYQPAEYAGMDTFTGDDGRVGFALKGNDIVSVFKHPDSQIEDVVGKLLPLAVAEGGRKLDAFDTVLPKMYAANGFRAVARVAWNDEFAPADWDYETFKKFNGGRPDVVFMVYDPANAGYNAGDGPLVDYATAVQLQNDAVAATHEPASKSKSKSKPISEAELPTTTSPKLSKLASDAYAAVPERSRAIMEKRNFQIKTGVKLTDADPSLHKSPMRGWPPGSSWDQAEGLYDNAKNTMVVAQYKRVEQTDKWEESARLPTVMAHEMGHAVDFNDHGLHPPIRLSTDNRFYEAHYADVAALSAEDKAQVAYFTQEWSAGPQETFAELHAAFTSPTYKRDHGYLKIRERFRRSALVYRQLMDEVAKGTGPYAEAIAEDEKLEREAQAAAATLPDFGRKRKRDAKPDAAPLAFFTHYPEQDMVLVQARLEGDDLLGDLHKELLPGDSFQGLTYEEMAERGSGSIWNAADKLVLRDAFADLNEDPKWTKGEGGKFTGSEPGQGGGEGGSTRERAPAREKGSSSKSASSKSYKQPKIRGVSPKAHPAKISPSQTRTNKKTVDTDQVYVSADVATMQLDEVKFRHNMELMRDRRAYPAMRPSMTRGSPESIMRAAKGQMKANIRFALGKATPFQRGGSKWYRGARALVDKTASKYKLNDASVAGVYAALSPQKDWDINIYLAESVIDVYQTKQNHAWDGKMQAFADKLIAAEKAKSDKAKAAGKKGKLTMTPLLERIKDKQLSEITNDEAAGMWIRVYEEAHGDHAYRNFAPDGTLGDFARNKDGSRSKASWNSTGAVGNAVAALRADGDREKIGVAMGEKHKVRNFYNNILDPESSDLDVTMDTHAIGLAWLRPNAVAEAHGLASTPGIKDQPEGWVAALSSAPNGSFGTYGLYADAYREVAEEEGMLPHQVQAIVWGVKRDMFGDMSKAELAEVDNIWQDYHVGNATLAQTQELVWQVSERSNARRNA